MWLIVGLGNPGSKYLLNRHNVGFVAIDYLSKSVGVRNEEGKSEHQGKTVDFKWESEPVKLVKPETFMNLSGDCVSDIVNFYKIETEKIIIVHDELDLPFGQMRLKKKGGDGGHNGVSSLIERLGTDDFLRVRIGIGRPPHPEMSPASFVLQNFSKEEQASLPTILEKAVDAIEAIVFDDPLKAMNTFNTRDKEKE